MLANIFLILQLFIRLPSSYDSDLGLFCSRLQLCTHLPSTYDSDEWSVWWIYMIQNSFKNTLLVHHLQIAESINTFIPMQNVLQIACSNILIKVSLKFVSEGLVENESVQDWVVAWHQTYDKPEHQSIIIRPVHIYTYILASSGKSINIGVSRAAKNKQWITLFNNTLYSILKNYSCASLWKDI